MKCSVCGKDGHTADYCYQNKQGKNANAGGNAGNKNGGKGIRSVKSVESEDDEEEEDNDQDSDGQIMVVGETHDDFEVDYLYLWNACYKFSRHWC